MLTMPSLPAPRPPCGDAERRAARRLHDELRGRGMEAWVEAVWLRPQWLAGLALTCLVTAAGGVATIWAPVPGAAATVLGAAALAVEAAGRSSPARWVFPRRATQDVLVPPEQGRVALHVCAGYDTGRAGWALRAPREPGARVRWAWARRPRGWLALAGLLVAGCAVVRWAGVEGHWLGWLQALPTVALLAGVGAAVDAGLAGWAGDRGEAVAAAVALAIHDELVREPPRALAPGLILYGAGSTGASALRARLRHERARPDRTIVIDLRPGRAATPAWRASTRQLGAAAARAAAALELPAAPPPPGLRLGTIPTIRLAVPAHAGPDALWPAIDLALGIADALDAEVARPAPAPAG